jgi:hypothetical protein
MAATVNQLAARVKSTQAGDTPALTECLNQAQTLIEEHVKNAPVPPPVYDLAVLTVAADLWAARKAPNGIANQQFAGGDGLGSAPLRISRDPLAGVGKLLAKWVIGL